jgi:hypothetical protein
LFSDAFVVVVKHVNQLLAKNIVNLGAETGSKIRGNSPFHCFLQHSNRMTVSGNMNDNTVLNFLE